MNTQYDRAVVIGASIAGLLAARVLAERCADVLIVDRDEIPDAPSVRKSTPQAGHGHALLTRGASILEALFPGFEAELVSMGAVRGRSLFFSPAGYNVDSPRIPESLMMSRPLLEHRLRRRVLALPHVRCRPRCAVGGFAPGSDSSRVRGVMLDGGEVVEADLVVDAGGRGSRAPQWLRAIGCDSPAEDAVEVRMGYATGRFARRRGDFGGATGVFIAPSSRNRRACGMFAQEGDRWILSLGGYCGDFPPADESGFLDFARSLPCPDVYEVIRGAAPLGPIAVHRFPSNLRRRYDRMLRFPENLMVMGDALCSFTPIYGQGMTVAALEAEALARCLRGRPSSPARMFFRSTRPIVDAAWELAVGNDTMITGAEPRAGLGQTLLRWYIARFQIAACRDAEVAAAFRRVAHMMAPPRSLLAPKIVARVLACAIAGRLAGSMPAMNLDWRGGGLVRPPQPSSNIPSNRMELR